MEWILQRKLHVIAKETLILRERFYRREMWTCINDLVRFIGRIPHRNSKIVTLFESIAAIWCLLLQSNIFIAVFLAFFFSIIEYHFEFFRSFYELFFSQNCTIPIVSMIINYGILASFVESYTTIKVWKNHTWWRICASLKLTYIVDQCLTQFNNDLIQWDDRRNIYEWIDSSEDYWNDAIFIALRSDNRFHA